MSDYDVIVLGTGAAGLTAAVTAAELSAKVGLFEKGATLGGTTAPLTRPHHPAGARRLHRDGVADQPSGARPGAVIGRPRPADLMTGAHPNGAHAGLRTGRHFSA